MIDLNYIVFTRNPHNSTPLASWLKDIVQDTVVITKKQYEEQYAGFFNTIGLDDYDSDQNKYNAVKTICENNDITHIGVLSEFDLISVAKLREAVGIRGQSVLSASCFRNKLLMKKFVSSCGVPVPRYRCVRSFEEIKNFASSVDLPIILKPIDGAGSVSVKKISTVEELEELKKTKLEAPLLAEEYISGGMVHADGVFEKGEITLLSISKYYGSCLSHQTGESLGSYQLEMDSALWEDIKKFLLQVLGAVPCPQIMGFHAEFFHRPGGELVFCEIASRLGGGRIIDCIAESHGLNLAEYWLRKQLGLITPEIPMMNNLMPHGFALIAPKKGTLKHLPEKCPFDWIKGYIKNYKGGEVLTGAASSVDNIVSYIVYGKNREQVKERLKESIAWFNSNVVYE